MKSPYATLFQSLVAKSRHPQVRLTHKTQALNRHLSRRFILPGALVLALVAVVGSAASFGPSPETPPATEHPAAAPSKAAAASRPSADRRDGQTRAALGAHAIIAPLTAAFQLPPEDIESLAADCATPKTSFSVGDTVCVKVSGSQFGQLGPRRVYWVNPEGAVVQNDIVRPGDPTNMWPTRVVSARGAWRLYLVSGLDGTLRKVARFSVSAAANPSVDLSVDNTIDRRISSFAAGHNITYLITVENKGPDAAANVVFTEQAPNNSTFNSSTQATGFSCQRAGGTATCTIASLPAGVSAEFTSTYTIIGGTPSGTEINATATVASDTEELHAGDNTSTASVTLTGEVTATECVLRCPEDIVVIADTTQDPDGTGPIAPISGALVSFGAEPFGECGEVSHTPASGSFFPVGTTPVSATSATGGGACSFNVTVMASGGPTISCPTNVVTDATSGCSATVNPGTPTTTGEGVTVEAERSDGQLLGEPFPVGTTTITWTATDSFGRVASCTQTVKVNPDSDPNTKDTTPPTFTTGAPDLILSTGTEGGACGLIVGEATLGTPEVEDNGCSVSISRTGVPAGNFFPVGETTVTWTATDASGNTATDTQTVTIVEDTPPAIRAPADATYTCPSEVPAADPAQATGADDNLPNGGPPSDNCGVPTVTVSETSSGAGSATSPLIIKRTFTATDAGGKTAFDVQTITVIDNTPPTITAPDNVSVNADAVSCAVSGVALGAATASDNCTYSVTNNAPAPFPLGQTTVTWTATDGAGNTATDIQLVTVVDVTAPTISLNGANPLVVECHTSFTDPGATATDACKGSFPATAADTVDVNTPGTYTISYTATDDAGNNATSVTRTVNVVDTTPPTIALNDPSPMTVECHTGFTDPGATASDGCAGNLTSAIVVTGSVNPDVVGSYTLTYTVSDGPNTTTVNRVVTVVDTTPPVISCPANIVAFLPLNSTATSMLVNYAVTATDSCSSSVAVVSTPASGSVFPVGTTTVNSTATDPSGNSSSCSFTVTVLYNFTGFFSPVSNLPVLNNVNAGRTVPLKFSLSGNKGLGIFAADSPASQQVSCSTSAPITDLEGTETSGGSTLTYDASSDQYHYNWKTEKAWAGTCRVLVVKLNDGSTHTANFKFK